MDDFAQTVFSENGKTYKFATHGLIQIHPLAYNMRLGVHKYLRTVAQQREIKYIVDVGACVGAFAIPYTIIFPDADILCIEPSSWNFPFLKYNTSKFPSIEIVKLAAHDKTETVRIANPSVLQRSMADSDYDTGMISIHGESLDFAETVPADRLDNVVERRVDWLKVDVEGHEVSVLKGAKKILSNDRPILQVEFREENLQMAKTYGARLMVEILKYNYAPVGSIRGDMLFRPTESKYDDLLSAT